ncbi:MAG: InlB B-repeat-containing protein [Bacilli bacterium]|nr:InlB B-repeat-containing protein [Bacilli bacterium]
MNQKFNDNNNNNYILNDNITTNYEGISMSEPQQIINKNKIPKVMLITAITILVIFIAVLLIMLFNNKKEKNESSHGNQNINNAQTDKDNNSNENTTNSCNFDIAKEYNLIFDTMGGSEIDSIVVRNENMQKEILPTPTKTQYIFAGWYYDRLYKNKVETNLINQLDIKEIKDNHNCTIGYEDIVLYAKWTEPEEISDTQLNSQLNQLMQEREYNSYAIKVINSFIPDYQKIFTNNEIYNLFYNVTKITLNPYDPQQPNLSHTDRAYNAGGYIVVNCFEGELDNDKNWDGLRWLLTHEIIHSLGEFPAEEAEGSFGVSITLRNRLLEEGLADSIANFVKGTAHDNKFAIKSQNYFAMYRVDSNYNIKENEEINHTYTISGNIINNFKYIGCYDELIHANIDSSFNGLKNCMSNNVKNGEEYYNKLFKIINNIYIYTEYPNNFYTKDDLNDKYSYNTDIMDFINNNNLNDLLIEYADLSAEIINNKIDNTYSICDFYKNNAIFYSKGNNEYKSNLICN